MVTQEWHLHCVTPANRCPKDTPLWGLTKCNPTRCINGRSITVRKHSSDGILWHVFRFCAISNQGASPFLTYSWHLCPLARKGAYLWSGSTLIPGPNSHCGTVMSQRYVHSKWSSCESLLFERVSGLINKNTRPLLPTRTFVHRIKYKLTAALTLLWDYSLPPPTLSSFSRISTPK